MSALTLSGLYFGQNDGSLKQSVEPVLTALWVNPYTRNFDACPCNFYKAAAHRTLP